MGRQISNSQTLSVTSLTVLTLCMVGLALGQGGQGGAGGMGGGAGGGGGGGGGAGGAAGQPGSPGGRRRRQAPPSDGLENFLGEIVSICSDGGESITWDQLNDCSKGEKLDKLKEIFKPNPDYPMLTNPDKKLFEKDDKNNDGKVTVEEIKMSMMMN